LSLLVALKEVSREHEQRAARRYRDRRGRLPPVPDEGGVGMSAKKLVTYAVVGLGALYVYKRYL
jgi:hypothetical protein